MVRHGLVRRSHPVWILGGMVVVLLLPMAVAARLFSSRPSGASTEAADFSRGSMLTRHVSLTFDADDQSEPRPQVIDILGEHGVRTTFFLTGRFIEKHPDIVRRIVRDGHEVGNHSYDHPELTIAGPNRRQLTLPTVTKEMFHEQLRRTARVFTEATGTRMAPLWRAPGGDHNEQIRAWAAELGYVHVGWTQDAETGESLDSLDWVADEGSGLFFTPAQIRTRLLNFGDTGTTGANGGIALFHLGSQRPPDTAADHELEAIIDGFRRGGYRLVRVSELYDAAVRAGMTVPANDDEGGTGVR